MPIFSSIGNGSDRNGVAAEGRQLGINRKVRARGCRIRNSINNNRGRRKSQEQGSHTSRSSSKPGGLSVCERVDAGR